jgi:4-hydroxy-tetrahydrodipicolinate synthase
MSTMIFPRGIISVVQTPFNAGNAVDEVSLERLVERAVASGVNGLVAPVVASEVAYLSLNERKRIISRIARSAAGRVPFILGASSDDVEECAQLARYGETVGATGYLVSVPAALYADPAAVMRFFARIARTSGLPLLLQDLQWNGPGLSTESIAQLRAALPTLKGIKIETLPAGQKYTEVRNALGRDFFIAGGWAVMQMIEALDRRVDAMIPESSMVAVYAEIYRAHQNGERDRARSLFEALLPVLAFANQTIATSVAFFKRLLVRRGIFGGESMRMPGFGWDDFNGRIAEELIEHYLVLEGRIDRKSGEKNL